MDRASKILCLVNVYEQEESLSICRNFNRQNFDGAGTVSAPHLPPVRIELTTPG